MWSPREIISSTNNITWPSRVELIPPSSTSGWCQVSIPCQSAAQCRQYSTVERQVLSASASSTRWLMPKSTSAFLEAVVFQFPGLSCVKGALRICVVGLHCCGDLTPSILTLFTEHTLPPLPSLIAPSSPLPSLTALVLVGCCYHKTAFPQWSPVSRAARELMKGREDLISTYALRLAAQETRER